MRNLVALQHRVWTLVADGAPSDACVAFAVIPGETQVFLLRESGRIEQLQREEDDEASTSQELTLLLDVNEFLEPHEDNRGPWRWMSYVAELGALICASTGGAIVSVDVDALDGEEVGAVDTGLRALAWSSNQEMLALVTGAGKLLVMSNDWEVLHETEIEASLPAGLELAVDTQHWECELCWREDSQYLVLNAAATPKTSAEVGAVVHKVLVYTTQLELHALGRLEDGRDIPGLRSALHWSQSMALIASSEVRRNRLFVVFFERNGLRHGEFEIPKTYLPPAYSMSALSWNVASDILAVSLSPESDEQQSVVQLWMRNNYHWYLKQELRLRSGDRLVDFQWDEEIAGRAHLLTWSPVTGKMTFCEHEFAWDVCKREAELLATQETEQGVSHQDQSVAVTGVIDGSRLLLTPLHRAMVPPPFALHQAKFDTTINSVVFDAQSESLLALLASGELVLIENYLSPQDERTSAAGLPLPNRKNDSKSPMNRTSVHLPAPEADGQVESLQWMRFCVESRRLTFTGKMGPQDQLVLGSVICSIEDTATATLRKSDLVHVRRVCEVLQVPFKHDAEVGMLVAQVHSGAVYIVNPTEPSVSTKAPGRFPAFSHMAVLQYGSTVDQEEADDLVVIGLDGASARLLVNGELLASACSSFSYCALPSVLLFTTQGRDSQLRMVPVATLRKYKKEISVSIESRSIERGALLVATIGQRANVVVRMPRGNLECIAPRLLVLALVVQQIKTREFAAALEICRRHRLDLNVLVDFDPQGFLSSFGQCLVNRFLSSRPAAVTSDRLCLFITNLHPVDVWATKYGPLLAPFGHESSSKVEDQQEGSYSPDSKVNTVCQAMMRAIQELEAKGDAVQDALLLPFVTCAVKQSPPRYDDALGKVQALLHLKKPEVAGDSQRQATRAIKHLIMLTDVDSLYSEALGLYDLDLVRTVATHSQRDPKEYVPFLDRVDQLDNILWRKFTIDEHLGRHERALTHLSALINEATDEMEASNLHDMALEIIRQGELYDQGVKLFPLTGKRSLSESESKFCREILLLKGSFLETAKKYEAAAYVYLSASDQEKARRAFLAANKWQMALALSARNQPSSGELRDEAYSVAQELLNRQQQQRGESVADVLAVARIYVEYCDDIDEAVGALVAHQQWSEALRIAYLHKRDDLVESDVEAGVLQNCDDILEELERNERAYVKHWKRLTTIREQKRLFKLHGIDGSRWDGDADAASIRSGASSAADSALSNASMSSVGSHNSAASIGNFSMQSLSAATASHFYATQALGSASKAPKSSTKHGGMPSRRERRKRMKEGSAEEEAYVEQQLSELRPSAALAREVGGLLEMLLFFGHIQQAQKLQTQLAGFEKCVATNITPSSVDNLKETFASEAPDYPEWRLEALQG